MIAFFEKQSRQLRGLFIALVGGLVGFVCLSLIGYHQVNRYIVSRGSSTSKLTSLVTATPQPTSIPSPSPSATPKPLTFTEMNQLYGPCVSLPVLMYHHIQSEEQAKTRGQIGLTVYTPLFKEQLQYLKDKGYTAILPTDLIEFFRSGLTLPQKSILITIDDGYDDNYTDAFPSLKEIGFRATIFMITGLADNPGYLTWSQIAEMNQYGIYFGNHTWSHQNMKATTEKIVKEVGTAETQLSDHKLNSAKIFAYPYGLMSPTSIDYLKSNDYGLAFDTLPGRIQCAKKKFELTRIRVGNTKLSSYGL